MIKRLFLLLFIISISFGQNIDSVTVKTPKKAALWSILPGGGQIYNGKYLKAGILITIESLAVWQSIENGRKFDTEQDDSYLTKRNEYAWWVLLAHLYGTLDAVVDSHLESFNEIMNDDSLEAVTDKEEILPDG